MNFLVLLLFIGSLLRVNGLSGNVGPRIWSGGLSPDRTKAGKPSDADSGMKGRIVGGEQAGMKDAPWQVGSFFDGRCAPRQGWSGIRQPV